MRGIKGLVTETSLLDPEEVKNLHNKSNNLNSIVRVFDSVVTASLNARSFCPRLRVEASLFLKVFSGCLPPARSPPTPRCNSYHTNLQRGRRNSPHMPPPC